MKIRKLVVSACALGLILAACMQCDKGTNGTTFSGPLELVYPKAATTTLHVGDSVTIRWSIHDTNQISSVEVLYSLDSGATWPSTQVLSTAGSQSYPDTTLGWKVTSNQVSTKFMLKVRDYNNTSVLDKSSAFTVAQ